MIVFLGCMLILSAAAHPMKRWKRKHDRGGEEET
jgi:hypothetical protein